MNLFSRHGVRAKVVPGLLAAGLFACASVQASGGDPPPAGPLPRVAPATPLSAFAKRQLGILDSTYQRAYLVAAWRVLDNASMTDRDLVMLTNALSGDTGNAMVNSKGEKPWPEARKRYGAAADEVSYLSGESFTSANKLEGLADPAAGENEYLSYSNCNFAATKTAADTLTARAKQFGDASQNRWVKEWVKGQDQVFHTCEGTYDEPALAPADAPQWFKYDRQYQRAAALMYTGRFAEARTAFDAIAKETRSPWSELAPYLAARVTLRQASLTVTPQLRLTRLEQARQLFDKLQRTGTAEQRRLAKPMLGRIAVELNPGAVLAKANLKVGAAQWDAETEEQLGNLLTLIRKAADNRDGTFAPGSNSFEVKSDGSLADWILSFGSAPQVNPAGGDWDQYEGTSAKGLAEKVATWCTHAQGPSHKAAWTIACLTGAAKREAVPAPVWQYAVKLDAKHPAYATVSYHLARLQMDGLKDASAAPVAALRTQMDAQLALGVSVYGADGLNAMRLLRARLATSLQEYAQLSTLTVLGEPDRYAWYTDRARSLETTKELHPSVPAYMTYGLGVDDLVQVLGQSGAVPTEMRKSTVGMAWVRAALLRMPAQEATLTPLLVAEVPALKSGLAAYRAATDEAAKQFELVQLVLQYEELDLARVDQASKHWRGHWGTFKAPKLAGFRVLQPSPAALKERSQLKKVGTYTDFVGETALAYAALAPQDPRLAETLATVVALTRHEAVTSPTLSKRAFTALHKLYPQSKAAKRTKYWY